MKIKMMIMLLLATSCVTQAKKQLTLNCDDQSVPPPLKTTMGQMYLRGEYVERNVAQAIVCLTQAGEREDSEALLLLGRIYYDGLDGIAENKALAEQYLLKSIQLGNGEAYEFFDHKKFGLPERK
jgi:TPR repeat protein